MYFGIVPGITPQAINQNHNYFGYILESKEYFPPRFFIN